MNFKTAKEMKKGSAHKGWIKDEYIVNEGPDGQELGMEAVRLLSKHGKIKMIIFNKQRLSVTA